MCLQTALVKFWYDVGSAKETATIPTDCESIINHLGLDDIVNTKLHV